MSPPSYEVRAIGHVESPLRDPAAAPRQGDEGAADAWLVFEPSVLEAIDGTPIVDVKPVLREDAAER